jgi:hypothetical protein
MKIKVAQKIQAYQDRVGFRDSRIQFEKIKPQHRAVLQFEYILRYTRSVKNRYDLVKNQSRAELTALWLTSFLSHWGMYRASSNLPETNISFMTDLVQVLLDRRSGILKPFFHIEFDELRFLDEKQLDSVLKNFREWLDGNGVTPTATLISKIILGLTQTLPAYDRFFCSGLAAAAKGTAGNSAIRRFDGKGIRLLSTWASEQKWPDLKSRLCGSDASIKLPMARMVDIVFFQAGSEIERLKLKKN